MKGLLAALLLLSGCGSEAPPQTDRSVWWAPLASWSDYNLSPSILELLTAKGIDVHYIGGHGVRIWAPWERHAEAVDLLRASPQASKLRIHTLLAGPRPNAFLPKLEISDEGAIWTQLLVFTLAEVPAAKLQAALHAENIECGVVVYEGSKTGAHLFVPPSSVAAARRLLKSPPWAGILVLD